MAEASDKYKGAVLGAALGDALGRHTEGKSRVEAKRIYKDGLRSVSGPLRYSDDTELAISIMESLVEKGYLNQRDIADKFVVNRSPNRGYSLRFQALLESCKDGSELIKRILKSKNSDRPSCGAAMRAYQIGLFHADSPLDVEIDTEAQTFITHYDKLALAGAQCAAQAVALALKEKDLDQFRKKLSEGILKYSPGLSNDISNFKEFLEGDSRDIVDCLAKELNAHGIQNHGTKVAFAAMWSFLKSPQDFEKTIHTATTMGGDTDSIATIAGAISGAYNGLSSVPSDLLERLEKRSRLEQLAEALSVRSQQELQSEQIARILELKTQDLAENTRRTLDTVSEHVTERYTNLAVIDVFSQKTLKNLKNALQYLVDFNSAGGNTDYLAVENLITYLSKENEQTIPNEHPEDLFFWSRVIDYVANQIKVRDSLLRKATNVGTSGKTLDVLRRAGKNITFLSPQEAFFIEDAHNSNVAPTN